MITNKKGVTDIILAIGVLVAIIMVLFIGIRIFTPLIKEEPEFIAKELALTGSAVLAAPENVKLTVKVPDPKIIGGFVIKDRKLIIFFGKINFKDGKAEGYRYKIDKLTAALTPLFPAAWLTSLSYSCDAQECRLQIGGVQQKASKDGSSAGQFTKDDAVEAADFDKLFLSATIEKKFCKDCYDNKKDYKVKVTKR